MADSSCSCMETISDRAFVHSGFCTEAEFAAPIFRARNNGRSMDNVRTDWGNDQSTFRIAGHVDRSQSVVSIVISM